MLTAPAAFVCAAAWYWYMRDRPADHPGVSPAELALIDEGGRLACGGGSIAGAWKIVLRNRQVMLLTASYFLTNYVFYFFLNWGFYYLVEIRGFKMLEGGGLASLWWLSGAVGAPLGGWWCDRLSKRIGLRWGCRWPGLVGSVACSLAMLAAAVVHAPYAAVAFLCLGLAFQQFTDSDTGRPRCRSRAGTPPPDAACSIPAATWSASSTRSSCPSPPARSAGWPPSAPRRASPWPPAVLWLWIEADRQPFQRAPTDSIFERIMSDMTRLTTALEDRYRIERELGAGGMATVYLATDLKHDREVALKVLRPELGAVLGAERFLAEIKITARLDHPHILTLIDSGAEGGFLYYVLPFVRGESLRDKLNREHQLGLEEALTITRQVASALDYAHRHGVVHRDIKPENILLLEGEAMLADFGIALAVKRGRRQPPDRDRALARHAAVHEPRAGHGRPRSSTRGATSTRSPPCSTRCSPASRRSPARPPRR